MKMPSDIISELREELAGYSRMAFSRRLVSGTGGNLSVRIPETDTVLVTPRGVSLGEVGEESSLLLDLNGAILENPRNLVPSKESSFHLAVYRHRPEAGAVAHLHPPFATAYSALGNPLPLVTVSSRVNLAEVPCIDCALPGSEELCDLVRKGIDCYPNSRTMLMKDHGILAIGADLKTAFYLADLVEDTANVAFLVHNLKARGD